MFWASFSGDISKLNLTLTSVATPTKVYKMYNFELTTDAITAKVPFGDYILKAVDQTTGAIVYLSKTLALDATTAIKRNTFTDFTVVSAVPTKY